MTAYYNEINEYAAQYLENLIHAGHIANGVVDTRSIEDVRPSDLKGFKQCHFFAGLGGWSLALRAAGWSDDRPVWTGSCPCQPFSAAGGGAGFADERHLYPYFGHLIKECKPSKIVGEQVASKGGLEWFGLVRADLEASGYSVAGADLCAAGVGSPHIRQRLYWFADSERDEQPWKESCSGPAGRVGRIEQPFPWDEPWERALPRFLALGNGIPRSVGATDAARNAIVPQVAQLFIESIMECSL